VENAVSVFGDIVLAGSRDGDGPSLKNASKCIVGADRINITLSVW
jgi:hypothetical protein